MKASPSPSMEEPEVNLRDPWLAAVLAWLVPGLGHLYQRRYFKAAIYSACIIGLWGWGMQISGWRINQAPVNRPGVPRSKTFSFLAQAGVGAPAAYAWYQSRRYNSGAGQAVTALPGDGELTAEFQGRLYVQRGGDDLERQVRGTLSVATTQGRFGDLTLFGRFVGTDQDGQPVEVDLEGTVLGPVLKASRQRTVDAYVIQGAGDQAIRLGTLQGTIPRGFWNWFQAPLDEVEEQELHRELGKLHELALVFTWIAGLLNMLAIWDAFEGPAYGYGLRDETEDDADDSKNASSEPATAAADPPARKAG
jgi:hypothetical protein